MIITKLTIKSINILFIQNFNVIYYHFRHLKKKKIKKKNRLASENRWFIFKNVWTQTTMVFVISIHAYTMYNII